jgi:predicted cobalt transporter CbtA
MMRQLLLRGMIAGLVAGLLAFSFAKLVGESSIEQAIALEASGASPEHNDAVHQGSTEHSHRPYLPEELVSRDTQSGIGLFVAIVVFTSSLGGIFALVFSMAYGRWSRLSARALSATFAVLGFTCIALIPYIKYPPNPPSVGQGGTIELRTALFFGAIAICVAALVIALYAGRKLQQRLGSWEAVILRACLFLVLVTTGLQMLPTINEVPVDFPASLLWNFRIAALGLQALIWASLGLVFGWLAEKQLEPRPLPTTGEFRLH